MADTASDHAPPAALADAGAAGGMQDGAVRKRDDATKTLSAAHGSSTLQGSPLASPISGTRKEIPPPPQSENTTKRTAVKPNAKEANLARQAAFHRVNARTTAPTSKSSPTTQSTTSSQPVLVNAAPKPAVMKNKKQQQHHHHHHRNGQPSNSSHTPPSDHSTLPPPESFTFPSILASLPPSASVSIDAIAEICGRSKLSLADEHAAHLPPQGEVEALPIARMETLDEGRRDGVRTRAMARRLAMANKEGGEGVAATTAAAATAAVYSGDATAATSSVVISHAPPTRAERTKGGKGDRAREARSTATYASSSSSSSLLPQQVLAWLRGSSLGMDGEMEAGAAGSLHRLLLSSEGREARP